MTVRPLVPYGGEVAREFMRGRFPEVVIFSGPNAHELAEHRRRNFGRGSALVIPAGRAPDQYRWPPLAAVDLVAPLMRPTDRARLVTAIASACTRTRRCERQEAEA